MAVADSPASTDQISLEGRVALVTGARRGLGRTMAQALVRAGAAVVFVDLKGAEEAAREAAAGGGKAIGLVCDVTREADCLRAAAAARDAFGALHILVNNAGKGPVHVEAAPRSKSAKFWEADPDAWQDVIVTNVNGCFLMARAAAPLMLTAGWGRVINITTSLGTMQRRENSPYGVSKAAIEAETLIWAQDLAGTGVSVNSLIPGGAVDTAFVSAATRRLGRALLKPDVMIAPLLWLASPLSDGVTGARFVGKNWNASLTLQEAARGAREPPVLRAPPDDR